MTAVMTKRNEGDQGSLTRRSSDPFVAIREEMNDFLSRFWGGDEAQNAFTYRPALDVSETDNAFEIRVDAPGLEPKDFDIQIKGNMLSLSGQREDVQEEKDKKFHRVERRYGSFSRTLTLPCDVIEDEVAAQYVNGVLSITLPKSEKSPSKKIDVKS